MFLLQHMPLPRQVKVRNNTFFNLVNRLPYLYLAGNEEIALNQWALGKKHIHIPKPLSL